MVYVSWSVWHCSYQSRVVVMEESAWWLLMASCQFDGRFGYTRICPNVMKPRTFNSIPGMRSVNERRRYNVTSPLIGWAHAQNDPWKPWDVMMLTSSSMATPVCRNDKLRFDHWRPSWYRDNPWVSAKELRTDLPQVRHTNNQISLSVRTWRTVERNGLGKCSVLLTTGERPDNHHSAASHWLCNVFPETTINSAQAWFRFVSVLRRWNSSLVFGKTKTGVNLAVVVLCQHLWGPRCPKYLINCENALLLRECWWTIHNVTHLDKWRFRLQPNAQCSGAITRVLADLLTAWLWLASIASQPQVVAKTFG